MSGIFSIVFFFMPFYIMAGQNFITLDQAVEHAFNNSERINIVKSKVNQADAKIDQSKASFLPNFSFEAAYLEQKDSPLVRGQSGIWGDKQTHTKFKLSQSLFDGWRDFNTFKASTYEYKSEKRKLDADKNFLYVNISKIYYAILSGERELASIEKTIELARQRENEIAQRVKIGKSRNIELTAAKSQSAIMLAQKISLQNQIESSYGQLLFYTGLPRDVKLRDESGDIEKPDKIENYLSKLDDQPEIISANLRLQASEAQMLVARGGHLPSVDLGANYYPSRSGTKNGSDWDVGLTLTLPLFSGGSTNAQVREASEKKVEAMQTLLQVKRQREIEIKTLHSNLLGTIEQINALKSALIFSEQNYKQQESNYRFGQSTNLEVIQSLNTYQETKRSLDRAYYQALIYSADLKVISNKINDSGESE